MPGPRRGERIHIGIDWLGSIAFGHIESIGERVLIIGVGNTAMDCCRSSLRLGAKDVKVIARKPRQFFKASDWELEDAEEERVEIVVNHSPKEFVIEDGKLVGMRFDELEYELDGGGEIVSTKVVREVFLPCDDVVLAIGQENAFPWIERDIGHRVRPTRRAGRRSQDVPIDAARRVLRRRRGVRPEEHHLGRRARPPGRDLDPQALRRHEPDRSARARREARDGEDGHPRVELQQRLRAGGAPHHAARRIAKRFKKLDIEVELGFSAEQVTTEVERCLNCDLQTVFTADLCIECDACIDICPVDCLAITPNGTEQELSSAPQGGALTLDQQLFVSAPLQTHGARDAERRESVRALRAVRGTLPDRCVGHAEIDRDDSVRE